MTEILAGYEPEHHLDPVATGKLLDRMAENIRLVAKENAELKQRNADLEREVIDLRERLDFRADVKSGLESGLTDKPQDSPTGRIHADNCNCRNCRSDRRAEAD